MSWEDQGRQDHGWFGHGKAPTKDKPEARVPADTTRRIEAAAAGTVGDALPARLRQQGEPQFTGRKRARLTSTTAAWDAGTTLALSDFARRYFARGPDDPVVQHLRGATIGAAEATTHAELRDAAEALAQAVQTVGLDSWPRFIADAAGRTAAAAIGGQASNQDSPTHSATATSDTTPIEPRQIPQIHATGSKLAFVGGLGDSISHLIKGAYEYYSDSGRNADVAYFSFDQTNDLAAFIAKNDGDVTIVAHSYGADTAAKVVAAGSRVRQLITLDPVSHFPPAYSKVRANATQWIDFNAVGGGSFDQSNIIAGLGGPWSQAPAAFTDRFFQINISHSQIGGRVFINNWLRYHGL